MGLEPTKMRQDLKKSVSILLEREEKIISFGSDFSYLAEQNSKQNLIWTSQTSHLRLENLHSKYGQFFRLFCEDKEQMKPKGSL